MRICRGPRFCRFVEVMTTTRWRRAARGDGRGSGADLDSARERSFRVGAIDVHHVRGARSFRAGAGYGFTFRPDRPAKKGPSFSPAPTAGPREDDALGLPAVVSPCTAIAHGEVRRGGCRRADAKSEVSWRTDRLDVPLLARGPWG